MTIIEKYWEAPRNFKKQRAEVTLELLPSKLGSWVDKVAKSYQVPVDFVLPIACSVIAWATQGNLKVNVFQGWSEPLSFYTAPLLEPSNRKSAVVQTLINPILELQTQARIEFKEVARLNKLERDIAQNLRNQVLKKSEGKLDTNARAEISAWDLQLEKHKETKEPTYLIDDTTPEALVEHLCSQQSVASIQAEGQLFENVSRYSESGTPNLEAFNHAYSGEPISVHRKGKEVIYQDKPHLVLAICAQPEVVIPKLKSKAFVNNGFSSRFWITLGKSQLGSRTFKAPKLLKQDQENWSFLIKEIYKTYVNASAMEMSVNSEALLEVEQLHNWLEPQRKEMPNDLKHWAGKLEGLVVRVSALFALAENPQAREITAEQMKQGASLAEIMLEHASLVFAPDISETPEVKTLRALINPEFRGSEGFEGVEGKVFTLNQLFQKVKDQKWCTNARKLRAVLNELEHFSWIETKSATNAKAGRPSELYQLHPEAEKYYQEFFN
jgi:hypothetical protein